MASESAATSQWESKFEITDMDFYHGNLLVTQDPVIVDINRRSYKEWNQWLGIWWEIKETRQ